VTYQIEGLFLPLSGGVLALEIQAPETKAKLVESLLPAWHSAAASPSH
jgi:hypothetical protein